ncbi:hypothetical protein NE237_025277 [Protea cynaroides]|uniref:Pentatricopeptide repeat-containing protein n=1 Tax=Protea cynaroides TaxID=273540 RepID=A0A9Q0H3X1_9MAGN|nr:hypothetical protein NE237_025277 [Protea cynaroides]
MAVLKNPCLHRRQPRCPLCTPPRFISNTSLPPPEWIEPSVDVSNFVVSPNNLKLSPWINRILGLLNDSPTMESNLNDYCHRKFLIKLSPNFVAYLLRSTEIREKPGLAFRFFEWAGKQRSFCHKLES